MDTLQKNIITMGKNVQVSKLAFRKMDRGNYVTAAGLSVFPGESPDPEQVKICEAWLKFFCRPRKSINKRANSYSLKHHIEEYYRDRVYISNGAIIQACLNLGYQFRGIAYSSNCSFNLSMLAYDEQSKKWGWR